MAPLKVLLIDDEVNMLESLGDVLAREGHEVFKAKDGQRGIEIATTEEIDLVITDLKMPGMDGLTLLKELNRKASSVETVIITGYGTIESAIEAMRYGAFHYLLKPFRPRLILSTVRKIAERKERLQARLITTRGTPRAPGELLGRSRLMQQIFQKVRRTAASDATVLITGESGTGKELVAHAIHYLSRRREGPLVKVSCASLPETLMESELFGHERGAFTSAVSRKKGRFELANGGTLFLDEIGDIPLSVQAKLLRVLETREFERVGGTETVSVDVRLVAATNKDLEVMVERGAFRRDLYYRINVVPIHMPPLRDRREDIPLLAEYFANFYAAKLNKGIKSIEPEAMQALVEYQWPGNIRELRNYMERAVLFARGTQITVRDLPEHVARIIRGPAANAGKPQRSTIRQTERKLILDVLSQTGWNLSRTARLLGISRGTLYNKMRRYGLQRRRPRK